MSAQAYSQPIPAFARFVFGLKAPAKDGLWHRYMPTFPFVRLDDGTLCRAHGQIWCRYDVYARRWTYRQDAETEDDYMSRLW